MICEVVTNPITCTYNELELKALSLKVCKYITFDVLPAVWSLYSFHFMSTNRPLDVISVV